MERMETNRKATLLHILPFAAWMALLFALPATAVSYAVRSAVTLAVGVACIVAWRRAVSPFPRPSAIIVGILAGAAVCALWIVLPAWPFPEPAAHNPPPYAPSVCGWPLTVAKLVGSAFVIAPVEEVFFRSFLYRWLQRRDFLSVPASRFDLSAFLWTVLLFTLEHDRPIAAAITGVAYGLVYVRFGLASAIAAHVTTNLLLALHVIHHNAWQFW
jgi:CAAX prenyl protease-like protein